MTPSDQLFQAIQEALPKVFEQSARPLTMKEARPLIENDLKDRGFNEEDLNREVYRHIHQSSINVVNPRAAYRGVRKILWNDADRTFRLLSTSELTKIAAGITPDEVVAGSLDDQKVKTRAQLIARESLVRDYVAKNLHRLEDGLILWSSNSPAVEHPIASRYIDIFAKDASDCPVIIELKLHRAYDRVLGQALLYRSLVRQYYCVERVRIVLIAECISEELKMAAQDVSEIQMFEYKDLSPVDEHMMDLDLISKYPTSGASLISPELVETEK